jgi:signal transduction histidine kinase
MRDAAANVLILYDAVIQLPANAAGRQAFEQAVLDEVTRPVTIFDESLDLERFTTAKQQQRLQAGIIDKYRDRPLDVIVAIQRTSLEAARALRRKLVARPGVDSIPILYIIDEPGRPADSASLPRGAAMSGFALASNEMETGRRMRTLMGELREVAVIASRPEQARALINELRTSVGETVRFVPMINPTPASARLKLTALRPPAAAFYFRVLRDSAGAGWLPVDYLRQFADSSPVPIFSTFPAYVGAGIVGGAMRDPAKYGAVAGRLAASLLNGTPIERITPQILNIASDRYDWQQLKRYELNPRTLPTDATFVGKPIPVWAQYPRVSAMVSALLAILAMAVVLLVRSGRRLRQVSNDRGHLAQHLLTVQETERQRIARDLHDDVCQEMSAIAVELDYSESLTGEHRVVTPHTNGGHRTSNAPANRLRVLVEKTRRVAHGLHAEPLSYAHLGQVLKKEGEALLGRHHIRCIVQFDESPLTLLPTATAGAYRIAMEALKNVVAHASATSCTVTLQQTRRQVEITITDDGIGFSGTPTGGLGLLSMRERALSLGGELQLHSAPFQGTRVVLTLPVSTPVTASPEFV